MYLPDKLSYLTAFPRWVAWELKPREMGSKELAKIPIDIHSGHKASVTEPQTWCTYQEAREYAEQKERLSGLKFNSCLGIGFVLGEGFAGIDIDHCVLEDGSLKDFAADIVNTMDSYTEYSPSGKGLHILFTVDNHIEPLVALLGKNGRKNPEIGLEIYLAGRYFTVTGQVFREGCGVNNATSALKEVIAEYIPPKPEKHSNPAYEQP